MRQPALMDPGGHPGRTVAGDEHDRDRPPVWDAVETDLHVSAADRRRPGSAERIAGRQTRQAVVALAVASVVWLTIQLVAPPLASLLFAALIGLFCYLSQDGR